VGLAGYGRFGRIHWDAIASIPDAEVCCICVGDKESAAKIRIALPQVEVYSDYDEFLQKGRIDVVHIVTPNYLHASQAMKAIARGKDVFLEKPIAINLEDGKELLEKKGRSGSRVQVGFESRYAPFWTGFKSNLENGTVKDPTFAKIESWRRPFRPGSAGWRYDGARVGHQLLEEAIHYFDVAAWFFGMPERVSGFTDSPPKVWNEGSFGTAAALLEYGNGLKVLIMNTLNGISEHLTVEVSGTGAMMGVNFEEEQQQPGSYSSSAAGWMKVRDAEGNLGSMRVEPLAETENVRLEIKDFLERIRSGNEPMVTLQDGFRALSLDLAAISAIGSGKIVSTGPKA